MPECRFNAAWGVAPLLVCHKYLLTRDSALAAAELIIDFILANPWPSAYKQYGDSKNQMVMVQDETGFEG